MIWRRCRGHLAARATLATASVNPYAYGLAAVLALLRTPGFLRPPLGIAVGFAAFVVLGVTSQSLAPVPTDAGDTERTNMFPAIHLSFLEAWNEEDGTTVRAVPTADGFWRLPRVNPATGREHDAFLTRLQHELAPGTVHTLSVTYRHDGTSADFELVVRTPDGRLQRPGTRHEPLDGNLTRAVTTFVPPERAERIRALHMSTFEGDWTLMEFGRPQLEAAASAGPYVASSRSRPRWAGIAWWLGGAGWAVLGLAFGRRVAHLPGRMASRWAAAGLVLAAGVMAVEAIVSPSQRLQGLLGHPNLAAHVAVGAAVLTWVLADGRLQHWVLVADALAIAMVLGSGSRTAMLGLVALFVVQAALGARERRRSSLRVVAVLIGLVAIVVAVLVSGGQRFDDTASAAHAALAERAAAWTVALDVFREQPWTGTGQRTFARAFETYVPNEPVSMRAVSHAHNLGLALLAEGGLLSTAGVVWLWGAVVVALARRRAVPSLAALGVFLALNLFDATLFHGSVYALATITAGYGLERRGVPAASNADSLRGALAAWRRR